MLVLVGSDGRGIVDGEGSTLTRNPSANDPDIIVRSTSKSRRTFVILSPIPTSSLRKDGGVEAFAKIGSDEA